MLRLLFLVALFAQSGPIPERLPPVESCSAEQGFDEFRDRLKGVVGARNEQALLAMLADDVEVNFGGDRGPALFAANWKFDEAGESYVWAELEEALSQGCTPSGDYLVAPSFVAQFPAQLDAFETVILPPGTVFRNAKSSDVPGVPMEWHLATIVDSADETWLGVRLVNGRRGFVRYDETVNPLDYRLVFENRGGRWMITAFLAGD